MNQQMFVQTLQSTVLLAVEAPLVCIQDGAPGCVVQYTCSAAAVPVFAL
jgi:hypothetical protein